MSMSDFSQHVPLSTFLQAHPDQGSLPGAGGFRRRNVSGGRGKGGGIPAVRGPDPHVLPGADR